MKTILLGVCSLWMPKHWQYEWSVYVFLFAYTLEICHMSLTMTRLKVIVCFCSYPYRFVYSMFARHTKPLKQCTNEPAWQNNSFFLNKMKFQLFLTSQKKKHFTFLFIWSFSHHFFLVAVFFLWIINLKKKIFLDLSCIIRNSIKSFIILT